MGVVISKQIVTEMAKLNLQPMIKEWPNLKVRLFVMEKTEIRSKWISKNISYLR